MTDWLLTLSFALHLLATVVWIGGLLLMSLLLWPEVRALLARGGESSTGGVLLALLDRLRKRFYPVATISLLVLIVTGLYQMTRSPYYEGVLVINNDWSRAIFVKHIAVIGMIGIGAVMQFGVLPALERATFMLRAGKAAPELEALRRRERRLNALNAVLGVFVLICTAAASSIR